MRRRAGAVGCRVRLFPELRSDEPFGFLDPGGAGLLFSRQIGVLLRLLVREKLLLGSLLGLNLLPNLLLRLAAGTERTTHRQHYET